MDLDPALIESMARDLYWQDSIPQAKVMFRARAIDAIHMWIANQYVTEAFPNAERIGE